MLLWGNHHNIATSTRDDGQIIKQPAFIDRSTEITMLLAPLLCCDHRLYIKTWRMGKAAQPRDWAYTYLSLPLSEPRDISKHDPNFSSSSPFFSFYLSSHSQPRLGDSLLKQKKSRSSSSSSSLYLDPCLIIRASPLRSAAQSTELCSVNHRFGYTCFFFIHPPWSDSGQERWTSFHFLWDFSHMVALVAWKHEFTLQNEHISVRIFSALSVWNLYPHNKRWY